MALVADRLRQVAFAYTENHDAEALGLFRQLDEHCRNRVYHKMWVKLTNSNTGAPREFGRDAFVGLGHVAEKVEALNEVATAANIVERRLISPEVSRTITLKDRVRSLLPLTLDEVARLLTYVSCKGFAEPTWRPLGQSLWWGREVSLPCGWKEASLGGGLEQAASDLRMRVLVNKALKIYFCGFRGTDSRNAEDLDLDLAILEYWKIPIAGAFTAARGMLATYAETNDWHAQFRCNHIPADPFSSVREASNFIFRNIMQKAIQEGFSTVVGGHSLGGAIAQFVSYSLSLPAVSIDGLFGMGEYLRSQSSSDLNPARTDFCTTVFIEPNNFISVQPNPETGTLGIKLGELRIPTPGAQIGISRQLVCDDSMSQKHKEFMKCCWHDITSFTSESFVAQFSPPESISTQTDNPLTQIIPTQFMVPISAGLVAYR